MRLKFGQTTELSYLCNRFKPVGALDEWLSQRSAKPYTPVRFG